MVRMRDGIMLATDIYLPMQNGSVNVAPLPVILERTPYDKSGISRSEQNVRDPHPMTRKEVAMYFARHGYVVVMQDCRGRYKSQGTFHKYTNEAEDGFDTLSWLVAQAWCDGRIGTMGLSYGAHTQCALACLDPPGLACMFIDSGGFSSAYHSGIRQGGAFELKQATWAYRHALLSRESQIDPGRLHELQMVDITEWFRKMPWEPGNSPLSAAPEYESYLFEQWREAGFSDYWQRPGLYAEGYYDQFPDIPVAVVGSWYDPYVAACLTNFIELRRRKESWIQLLMGPWTHGNRSVTFAGDVDFGDESTLDDNISPGYLEFRLAWFDRWLSGRAVPGSSADAPVTYFEMGGGSGRRNAAGRLEHGGRWRRTTSWPPPGVKMQTFHMHVDGGLRKESAGENDSFVEYEYDPQDPVPTIGGAVTSGDPVMQGGAFNQVQTTELFACREIDKAQPLAERADVIVFQTAPLENNLVLTGTPLAELWVSSDRPDTDFTVKLIDVYPPSDDYPDGYAMNITDGIFRVRYRRGWDQELLMNAGEICKISIEPFATSNVFRKGHRLRLDISSSNYPRFDINPNTGGPQGYADEFQISTNRVYCSAEYPSRIHLPIDSGEQDHPGIGKCRSANR